MTIILSGLAGWLAGAAGNWAADRLPARRAQRIADAGDTSLPWFPTPRDVFHAFTLPWYPFRRGVCPGCGERLPARMPLLEAAAIAACLLAGWRFHANPIHLAVVCLYIAFLLAVLVIDLEHRLVLNVMLAPAAVFALLASFLPGDPTPLAALEGGALGFGVFALLALIGRGKMGWGDVKLAGVIGLVIGYPNVLGALIVGIFLGGIAAVVLLVTRRAGRKSMMAYAPYLAIGAITMLLLMRP